LPNTVPFTVNGVRPIPYAFRTEVKAMLDNMERQGIIRTVTEPTDWTHPLVVVPKKQQRETQNLRRSDQSESFC